MAHWSYPLGLSFENTVAVARSDPLRLCTALVWGWLGARTTARLACVSHSGTPHYPNSTSNPSSSEIMEVIYTTDPHFAAWLNGQRLQHDRLRRNHRNLAFLCSACARC